MFGWVLDLEWEWKVFELPINAEILKQIKYEFGDAVYKFNKIDNLKKFGEEIEKVELNAPDAKYNSTLEKWKRTIKIEWGKIMNTETKEDIKYIGRLKDTSYNPNEAIEKWTPITDFFDSFKVEVQDNYVILSHPYIKGFRRKVDYNAFLMILMDNQLEPWTEKQFKWYELNYTSVAKAQANKTSKFWPGYYSIGNMIFSFKELINAAKQHFKDEDDFRAAEMLAGITGIIPGWVPVLGDLGIEANAEKEAKIWKRITSAKERLARADKWWNHAKVAANLIKEEIFKPVLKWEKLSYRKKLRAAGYLLYALEKGPGEYFRALADYAGKWVWVRALFGESHYQKWLLQNQQLRKELEMNPNDETLRNKLVFSEIFYMKDIPEAADLYSSNFPSTIEWWKINLYQNSKVNEVYEWEANKWNYYTIYDWWKSYILNNRPPNSLWAFKALSERVEEEDHYVDYYKNHLLMNLTGFVYNEYWTNLKEWYEKLARMYAIPIGLYAGKYDGLEKTLRILDYIMKSKWIRPGGKETLTEYLYGKTDPKQIHPLDIRSKKQRNEIIKKMEEFWSEYGDEIVRVLDYRDPLLLRKVDKTKFKDEAEYKAFVESLSDYFEDKVNNKISEDFAIDPNVFKTGYAPYYIHWGLNLGKKAFSAVAGVSNWDFVQGSLSKNVWTNLKDKLNTLSNETADSTEIFKLVFDKYLLWLSDPYKKPENKVLLYSALLSKNDDLLEYAIIDLIKDFYGDHITHDIPPEMELGLRDGFIKVFKSANFDDIVNVIKNKEKDNKDILAITLMDTKSYVESDQFEKLKSEFALSDKDLKSAENKITEIYENREIEEFLKEELDLKPPRLITVNSIIKKILSDKADEKLLDTNLLTEEERNEIYKFILTKKVESFLKNKLKLKRWVLTSTLQLIKEILNKKADISAINELPLTKEQKEEIKNYISSLTSGSDSWDILAA